jgi:hypothetical protein
MNWAIPPLPNTPPWRGAQLKHRENIIIIIIIIIIIQETKAKPIKTVFQMCVPLFAHTFTQEIQMRRYVILGCNHKKCTIVFR